MGPIGLFIAALGSSLLLSCAGTWLVRRISIAHGFVDRPGGHKAHAAPVALGGGTAITAAVVIPMLSVMLVSRWIADAPPDWLPEAVRPHLAGIRARSTLGFGIVLAATALCVMGLVDDARPLNPLLRFLFQLSIALVLTIGFELRLLSYLGNTLSVLLTVIWIVTLINSFNFLDNMDGLAAGVAAIAATVFAVAAMRAGQIFVPACCCLLAGSLFGFLLFNFHPASIFMGDAGSTVIGFLLAVFTVLTTFADPAAGESPIGVLAPIVVMAVPLYDTVSVFFLRMRSGVPVWRGDRRHFSHRLVKRGMPPRRAVLVIWLATLVTALPALLLARADWFLGAGIVTQTLLVVILVALLERGGADDPAT